MFRYPLEIIMGLFAILTTHPLCFYLTNLPEWIIAMIHCIILCYVDPLYVCVEINFVL